MNEEILKGFKEIAVSLGYGPDEVYFLEGKLILPDDLKEIVLKYSDMINMN